MLARLSIRDIVLIDRLDIEFAPGLTVLTGETGAGKSILLDAFALALGGRGDAALVRHGAEQGQVTAVVRAAAEAIRRCALLADNGHRRPTDELILRRVQLADGRTRAFVNDQPVSVQALQGGRRCAGRDPRPARRARAGRCRHPSPAARCLRRPRQATSARWKRCGTRAAPREQALDGAPRRDRARARARPTICATPSMS